MPGARRPHRASLRAAIVLVVALCGCQKPTEVLFRIDEPTNALLDPFSLAVSDYVLKSDDGAILAAVSQGANRDGQGRLGLGALDPKLVGEMRLDVLSGGQLVGLSRLRDVSIETGKTVELAADVRKPLVIVGGAAAPELTGPAKPSVLLDPTTATDLASHGVVVPAGAASHFTSDGRSLFIGGNKSLSVFDTGTGATVGPATLPFSPSLLTIAPHDKALALIERAPTSFRVLFYRDVAALTVDPSAAPTFTATLRDGLPRAAHFSPTGDMLYVLVEDASAEPCTGSLPTPNKIVPVDAQGNVGAAIPLPSYVADFAVDRGGRLVLSEPGAGQISTLTLSTPDGSGGVGAPVRLYAAACPTALRLLEDQVFAVTNDVSPGVPDGFALLRGRLDGSTPTRLGLTRPSYQTQLNESSTRDKLTRLNLEFVSSAVSGSEMAVSPDGSRAAIAIRTRYRESNTEKFQFVGLTCKPSVDIVEYGFYSVDLVTGTASYESRSQNTVTPADSENVPCVSCEANLGGFPPVIVTLDLFCPSKAGDRAAGLSAAFSGPP